ncbi:MAG: acetyl/propionyl/methylcrotonyl-CoA carboxylase subunit alpha [Aquabacterium sp.]
MADVKTLPPLRPIRRLLVANRGEIARRILRTAHAMGIATVAVYAEGDAYAPFVREADAAIALGGQTATDSYLSVPKLIDACRRSGADAVHPGYGFLSENADFAEAVVAAGLNWVGPPPDAIRQIGDKLAAKRLMQTLGVPTLLAHEIAPDEPEAATQAAAARIGFPVLIKASAGGGGRGMRIVATPDELIAAIASARREALASFANGTVFMERWLARSRHVEIQILGDRHGHLVHVFERECSIQRRHQKIIEEAPSPAVDAELRERMGQAALTAARAIGYHSTGTAEFLLSGREFFFLEVNTRLQVEHPVTEMITGLDLVREQIRVAEGEPLGFTQADLRIDGHAIEARVCAEDPTRHFLPSPGTVAVWQPALGPGLRYDSGVESGSVIGMHFDPMIAKVIAHAPTRREAAAKLARALQATRIQGITHNRDFLVATLRADAFLAGDTATDFIERVQPAAQRVPTTAERDQAAIACALFARAARRRHARVQATVPGGFRNSLMPPELVRYQVAGQTTVLSYRSRRDGLLAMDVDGRASQVQVMACDDRGIDLVIDGQRGHLAVTAQGDRWLVHGAQGDLDLLELPRHPQPERSGQRGGLVAPMPGKVLSVAVADGDTVTAGQLLLVLEAMKMEHRITAPADGIVKAMKIAVGDQVANGALLVAFEAAKAPT